MVRLPGAVIFGLLVAAATAAAGCQRPVGEAPDGGMVVVPGCGNGVLDPGEVCDDGNTVGGDSCSADCTSDETCGNGIVDLAAGELCDDGNTLGGDNCSADCKSDETCGNGVVDTDRGETCDDGNTTSGDMCSANCQSNESCGNGVVDADKGEQCDNGPQATATCDPDCTRPVCGDGVVNHAAGEDCDDHNTSDADGCTHLCHVSRCGDGIVNPTTEECDDGNPDNTDGCRNDCKLGPPNDVASGAIDISAGGTFTVDLTHAHNDVSASCNDPGNGRDVFYQFHLASPEVVYADTFGSTFDTTLAVFDGPCTARTTEETCDDDECSTDAAQIAGQLDTGTYCLVLDQNSPASPAGPATLTFRHGGRTGDFIDFGSGAMPVDTSTGDDQMFPSCAGDTGAPDLGFWFLSCPAGSVHVVADTCADPGVDSMVYVRSAADLTTDDTCSDDQGGACGVGAAVDTHVGGADLHWIVVDGASGVAGPVTLTYTLQVD